MYNTELFDIGELAGTLNLLQQNKTQSNILLQLQLRSSLRCKEAKWFELNAMNAQQAFYPAQLAEELCKWLRKDRMRGEKQSFYFET